MSREETEPYQVAQDALTVGAAIRPLEVRSFMMLYLIGGASSAKQADDAAFSDNDDAWQLREIARRLSPAPSAHDIHQMLLLNCNQPGVVKSGRRAVRLQAARARLPGTRLVV
jgi:hypothetical protein